MKTNHPRQRSRRFLHLSARALVLVLSILSFENRAGLQETQRMVRVKVTAYGCCNGDCPKLAGVNVGGATTGADGTAVFTTSPGKHSLTATAPGYNITGASWRGSWVQEDGVDLPQDEKGGYCTTRSVEAEFKGPPANVQPSGEFDEELTVSLVCDQGCKETEKQKENAPKEVAVTAASEDCKEADWEGSKISFGPPGDAGIPISMISEFPTVSLDKYGLAREKTKLRPGTYEVSFHHPSLETGPAGPATNEESGKYIGLAKVSKIEVYRALQKRELVGTYPADEKGKATVRLDVDLWKENNVPYVKVYVEKLCDVRFATVEFFEGQVEVAENIEGFKAEFRPAQSGMELFKNDTIRIAPGSSVQLKSQGGIYIIKMSVPKWADTAQLNVGTVITAEGRKFIEASTNKTATIEIKRVAIPKPPPEKPDPNIPPVPLPEPLPVSVKTPTLKVTDKKTAYMVSYDEKTGATTVGVEEGEVEVTPANTSLQPFTLVANQQVQVSEKSVGAITYYAGSGSRVGKILLYVGIGVAGLLVLLGLFFFFRRQHRLAMRPAFSPAGASPAGWTPSEMSATPPNANAALRKCPNSQCGKEAPAGKEFCAHCGARLNV